MTKNKRIVEISNLLRSMQSASAKSKFTIDMKFHILEAIEALESKVKPVVETITSELTEYSKELDAIYAKNGGVRDDKRVMLLLDVIAMPTCKVADDKLEEFAQDMEALGAKYSETITGIKGLLETEVEFDGIRKFTKSEFNEVSYFFIDPIKSLDLLEV